jgi:hypothetical protein
MARSVQKPDMVASFAQTDDFKSDAVRQEKLVRWFPHTPAEFWCETCVRHNGFFGIHASSDNAVSSPKSSPASSSINQTGPPSASKTLLDQTSSSGKPGEKDYIWHEMGFISFSNDSGSAMLCFDVPDTVIAGLEHTLSVSTERPRGPFGLHVPLLGELVKLYDRSIWTMATKVRDIEVVS